MGKPVLGVDVDITVVDTGKVWLERLEQKCGKLPRGLPEVLPYNLGELWGIPDSGMDFWRQRNLYDGLTPREHAVSTLEMLSEYWDIVFVSSIKGDHHKSKVEFLKKHFPFMSGFIATKEKQYSRVDMMIDDRIDILNRMPRDCGVMLFESPYTQNENAINRPHISISEWGIEHITTALEDFLNV